MQRRFWRSMAAKGTVAPAIGLLAVAVVMLVADPAWGCPTCKDGIAEADPAAQQMAAGYFYSILFMMSAPFVLLGTLGSCAYLSIRRARNQQVAGESSTDA